MIYQKFTEGQLKKFTIKHLRVILADLGGAPLNKPKSEVINEILYVQDGNVIKERSSKGRKRTTDQTYAKDIFKVVTLSASNRFIEENLPENAYGVSYGEIKDVKGYVEILGEGMGYLHPSYYESVHSNEIMVGKDAISSFKLRSGDYVEGNAIRSVSGNLSLKRIEVLNGVPFEDIQSRGVFEDLSVCYPNKRFNLGASSDLTLKILDVLSPIGKGQRGLIVAPEKSGKTTLLKKIAKCLSADNEVEVISVLVSGRPEEVTEYKREVNSVVLNLNCEDGVDKQIKRIDIALNRVKRIVETGKDAVLLIDDIVSLAKIYNYKEVIHKQVNIVDYNSLVAVKKVLGSARKIENGGSLTVIATVVTGDGFNKVVYDELRSVANMEITLAEYKPRGIFPAIIPSLTYTRNSELLLNEKELDLSYNLREIDDIREIADEITKIGEN